MAELPDSIDLDWLFDVRVELEPAANVGATPAGRRAVLILAGGSFEGPRMRGRVHAGGGDWALWRRDGVLDLDVRATLETDDGVLIYLTFVGIRDAAPDVFLRALAGEDVDAAAYYFRVGLRLETGAERYAWLNRRVYAGSSYVGRNAVALRAFALS